MELFLDYFIIFSFSLSIISNIYFLIKVRSIDKASNKILNEYPHSLNDIQEALLRFENEFIDGLEGIEIALVGLKTPSDSMQPSRANNWDSIREAFKGPIKVEVNE